MFKKIKTASLLLFFLNITLFSAAEAKSEKTVLSFWQLSGEEGLMRSLLDDFERENPDIKVEMQVLSWAYGFDKIVTAIAAGNAPDVCELGSTWVPKFSSAGVLLDVTEEAEKIKDQYLLWEPITYEGRIYGFPWLVGTRALFYNKDLFIKAGLDPNKPPQTWSQLLEYSKKINALDKGIYGFGIFVGESYSPWQQFLPFVWSNGGEVLSGDYKECLLNSPQVIEALDFYNKLKEFSLRDRQAEVDRAFSEGRVGTHISGAWNLLTFPLNNPKLNFGVALVPRSDSPAGFHASFAGGEVLVINKKTPHIDAAIKLSKFIIREENSMKLVRAQRNVLPSNKGSINLPYFDEHPHQKVFFKQMATAIPPPGYIKWAEVEEHITKAIEKVILQDVSPEIAIEEATQQINIVLKEEETKGQLNDKALTIIIVAAVAFLFLAGYICGKVRKKSKGALPAKAAFKKLFAPYVLLSPWLIIFLLFSLYPLIYSIIISFSKYNLLTSEFSLVGFKNYFDILTSKQFYSALWHTTFFAVGTIPFTVIFALSAALLINRKIPFKQIYQAGLFLPVVTSVIVISTIFTYMYSPDGLLNMIFEALGFPKPDPNWLMNTKLALPCIMAMCVWSSFGYYMVLFLAGLQAIPDSLYEAGAIDGANSWQSLWFITLPQLKPIILFVLVINTIHSFQVFPEVFTMTKGGPLGSTTTIVYHLYEEGFHRFQMGSASAIGYILFVIIMVFSMVQMRLFKTETSTKGKA